MTQLLKWPDHWLTRHPVPRTPWEEIFQLSLPAIEHDPEFPMGAYYLKELRTIRMGTGRQNGKTSWALDKLREIQESVLIVRDKTHRELISPMVGRKVSLNLVGTASVAKVIDDFHATAMPRVFTCLDLKAHTFRETQKSIDLKLVIIDDASQNTKLFDIYGYLAKLKNPNLVIIALG